MAWMWTLVETSITLDWAVPPVLGRKAIKYACTRQEIQRKCLFLELAEYRIFSVQYLEFVKGGSVGDELETRIENQK
jgi:hypothetical protein